MVLALIPLILAAPPAVAPSPRCEAVHRAEVKGTIIASQCFDFAGVRERWAFVPTSQAEGFEVALLSPGRPALHAKPPGATAILGVAFPESDRDGRRDVLVAYATPAGTRFLVLVQFVSSTTGRFLRTPEGEERLQAALPPGATLATARDTWKKLNQPRGPAAATAVGKNRFSPYFAGQCIEHHVTSLGNLVVGGVGHEVKSETHYFESIEVVETGHRAQVLIIGLSDETVRDGVSIERGALQGRTWRLRCSRRGCEGSQLLSDAEIAATRDEATQLDKGFSDLFEAKVRTALEGQELHVGMEMPQLAEALRQEASDPESSVGKTTAKVTGVTEETWSFSYEMLQVNHLLPGNVAAEVPTHGELIIDRRNGLQRSVAETGTFTLTPGKGKGSFTGHLTTLGSEIEVPAARCAEALQPALSDDARDGIDDPEQGGKAE